MQKNVKCMVQRNQFTEKPKKGDAAYIQQTIKVEEIDIEELAYLLCNGCSFRPGVLENGNTMENWVGQQLFALDFDHGVTIIEIMNRIERLGIQPVFIYTSFSHSEVEHRFRVVFCMNKYIKDANVRDCVLATLMGIIGDSDSRCINRNRMFYGGKGKKPIVLNSNARIDVDWLLEKFWKDEYEKYISSKFKVKAKIKKAERKGFKSVERNKSKENNKLAEEYLPTDTSKDGFSQQQKCSARSIIYCLEKFFPMRKWVEGSGRSNFLFIIYNAYKICENAEMAYNKVLEYNEKMEEPLDQGHIVSNARHSDEHFEYSGVHGDGAFTYSAKRVIEVLNIPEDIAKRCGFGETSRKRREGYQNNDIANARDKLIAKLYLVYGMGYKAILRNLPPEYLKQCKSKNTVCAILERLGIKGQKGNKELYYTLEFKRYSRKKRGKTLPKPHPTTSKKNYDEKKEAINRLLCTTNNIHLFGSAGTGKTTVAIRYAELLDEEERRATVFCANNGTVASKLPGGMTLHKLLNAPIGVIPKDYPVDVYNLYGYSQIIVDEIGQVRSDMFHYLVRTIDEYNKCFNENIRLIVVGDFGQIPPVVQAKDKKELASNDFFSAYAFGSELWEKQKFEKIKLEKVERQRNAEFTMQLEKLKHEDVEALEWISGKMDHILDVEKLQGITIVPTNAVANEINESKAKQLLNKSDRIKEYETIKNGNIRTLQLAKGMRIMTTRNSKNFSNGTIGTVTKMCKNKIDIVTDEGEKIEIRARELEKGKNKVFPIVYAFAITADKSQGMTIKCDVNVVPGFFAVGQLYVALSRVQSIEQLHYYGPNEFAAKELIINRRALLFAA